MENHLIHTAQKTDNTRRIYRVNEDIWNPKYVYSWDYDGPAVTPFFQFDRIGDALLQDDLHVIGNSFRFYL